MLNELFTWIDISFLNWLLLIVAGLLIGISKAGISSASMVMIPIMACVFGGKVSAGLMLPMLIIADIFAVKYYHRHASWPHIGRILPWAFVGIFIGLFVGNFVSDALFKQIMAVCILAGIGIMIWRDLQKSELDLPGKWWFACLPGIAGGFATMMGNAAGPIMSIYLLAMHLPKFNFIGTAAWFFFVVNVFKVPLHIFFWKTITLKSITINLLMAPAILSGVFLGIQIVKILPERAFRVLVIVSTIVAAFLLF